MLLSTGEIASAQAVPGIFWTQATGFADFPARNGHTSVVFDDGSGEKMWVMSGAGDSGLLNDVWYSADGSSWTQAIDFASFPWRYAHASVVYNNLMWMIGGSGDIPFLNDTWNSANGIDWTLANASAEFPGRYGHTSLVFDSRMWVIGGAWDYGFSNDTWYSTDGDIWTQAAASAEFPGRYGHSSVVFDNRMWVIGGSDGAAYLNDAWYSMDGITWTQATASAAFPARQFHTSVVFDNRMWVIGGSGDAGLLNDVWYSMDGITWTQATASAAFPSRSYHTSVVFNNMMWVIGGSEPGNSNDVWNNPTLAAPTLTGITPATWLNTGPVSITDLAGTGFVDGAMVNLSKAGQADIAATDVIIVSANQITCTFPINGAAPGAWDVVVTNPDAQTGTLPGGFTISALPPAVNSIYPAMGRNTGTIPVSNLSGTGFLSGATVNLTMAGEANITATDVNVASPEKITCTFDLTDRVPGWYNVVVTNLDGQSGILMDGFHVMLPPPVVVSISPTEGFNTGLVTIDISGNFFVNGAAVRLKNASQADIYATNVSVINPTQITCDFDLAGATTGTWNVDVINSDGQSSLENNNIFQFIVQAAASQVSSPASPPPSGGSGGVGHSSNDYPATQPAQPPVERQPATYYGEGTIDTTPAGINRDPVIIESADHGVSLAIDAGTLVFDSLHHPLTLATAKPFVGGSIPSIPGETGISFTGVAYDIGPDGATFNPPATLRITVPGDQWNENTRYSIQTYSTQASSWEEIPSTVDTESHIVRGQVSHLCLFGLFAAPAAGPATPAPTLRAPDAILQVQPETMSQTPMGIFTGMMGWIYATATAHIPVSFTIVLLGLAAIYASTRRAWLARNRTWIILYLISLTGLLWALFLSASGGPFWESAWILITVIGLNLIVHILRFDRIDLSSRARPGYMEIGHR